MTAAPSHTLVMASAGSGKTYQLTGAYLRHVFTLLREQSRGGSAPDLGGLLATTFTRKAAGEILARVIGRLVDACASERGLRDLSSQVGESVGREDALRALGVLAAQLHRLGICTIDALFQRLAWAHGHELGVPAGWRIGDERALQDQWSRAVRTTLGSTEPDELVRVAESLSTGERAPLGFSERLRTSLEDIRDAVAGRPDAEDVWGVVGPIEPPLEAGALAQALEVLARAPLPRRKDGTPAASIAKAHDALLKLLRAGDWATALKGSLLQSPLTKGSYGSIALTPAYRDALCVLTLHARAVLLTRLRTRNLGTMRLAVRLLREVQRERSRTGLMGFDDVPRMLLEAGVTREPSRVYEALDARVRHVLLDEFQDTSLTQFLLLRPVLDEVLAGDPAERSVFCVGDVKQSLYSWRGGAPTLMPTLPETWPQLHVQEMAESYRSSRVVLDLVTRVFQGLAGAACLATTPGAVEQWRARFTPHTTRRDLRGEASLWVCDDAHGARLHAARRVREIVTRAPWASVGVLVSTNEQVKRMLRSLRGAGVLASGERGTPLDDSAPVGIALSMLRLARFPGHEAAAFHIATSPLGATLGLRPAHSDREREDASRSLRRAFAERGHAWFFRSIAPEVRRRADARGAARYEQMLDAIDDFERAGGWRTEALLALLSEQSAEDPTQRSVRVMTIHASKGLEFDAVVLPYLCQTWDKSPRVLLERESPLHAVTCATLRPCKGLLATVPSLAGMLQAHREQQRDEALCGLYVALTRAVHSLDMFATACDLKQESKDGPASANSARVLLGTLDLDADPDELAAQAKETGLGCVRVHHAGDGAWADAPPSHATRDAAPRPVVAAPLAPAPQRAWEPFVRARRVQPSNAPAGATPASRPAHPAAAGSDVSLEHARMVGMLLHAWLSEVEWLGADAMGACERALSRAAAALRADEASLAEATALARRFLRSQAARCLEPSEGESATLRVLREWEFRLPLEDSGGDGSRIVAGRLDRLVLRVRDGRVVACDVLDYKTEAVAGPASDAAARHAPQLRAYAESVSTLFRVARDSVTMTVVFVREGVAARVGWEDA